jgi:hypothetical protein
LLAWEGTHRLESRYPAPVSATFGLLGRLEPGRVTKTRAGGRIVLQVEAKPFAHHLTRMVGTAELPR